MFTPAERRALTTLARRAICDEMHSRHPAFVHSPGTGEGDAGATGDRLNGPGAAFVTLHLGGELRGCIGYIEYPGLLRSAVDEVARKAAFEDPRFPPLTPDEIGLVEIQISVLSPLRRIQGSEEIQIGIDGLVVELGRRRGLLLPQVATQYCWSAEEFLENTARKAGLPPDAWRDAKAEIYAFSAEVFSEESEQV